MSATLSQRIQQIQKRIGTPQSGVADIAFCRALEALMGLPIAAAARLDERKKQIQKALGFTGKDVDGMYGPMTITRIEQLIDTTIPQPTRGASMVVSKKGLQLIIEAEVSSEAAYKRKYQNPVWPGGASGITIGIRYDVGYYTEAQIKADWEAYLYAADIRTLQKVAGLKGDAARQALDAKVKAVVVPWQDALHVFYTVSVPAYAAQARKVYPAITQLPPDAQAAILSLVYNRGTALNGERRTEMKNLVGLIAAQDLAGIARELRSMKRLWPDLPGLIKRREAEAQLVENATTVFLPQDCVVV